MEYRSPDGAHRSQLRVTSSTGASSLRLLTLVVKSGHPPLLAADFDDDLAVG